MHRNVPVYRLFSVGDMNHFGTTTVITKIDVKLLEIKSIMQFFFLKSGKKVNIPLVTFLLRLKNSKRWRAQNLNAETASTLPPPPPPTGS